MKPPARNAKWFNLALKILEFDGQGKALARDELARECDINDPEAVMEILNRQFAGFFTSRDKVISFVDMDFKAAFEEDVNHAKKQLEQMETQGRERKK